jgi:predicted permease
MLAWISSTIARPPAKRAAAIGIVNAMGNIGSIPGSYIFPSKYGPYYVKSFGAVLAVLSMACILAFTLRVYLKYLNRKLDQEELRNVSNQTESSESVNMRGFRYMY